MKFQYKSLLVVVTFLLLVGCKPSPRDMWKCTATDAHQQQWVQYAPTQVEASVRVRDRCYEGGFRPICVVRCIPPTSRWHCIAVDKGGHIWYWNSTSRVVAIRNARRACMRNTTKGGCKVPSSNCSMT